MKRFLSFSVWIVTAALLVPQVSAAAVPLQSLINGVLNKSGFTIGEMRQVTSDMRINIFAREPKKKGFVRREAFEGSVATHSEMVQHRVDENTIEYSARTTINNYTFTKTDVVKNGKRKEEDQKETFTASDVLSVDTVYKDKKVYFSLVSVAPQLCDLLKITGVTCDQVLNKWIVLDQGTNSEFLTGSDVSVGDIQDIANQEKFKKTPILIPVRLVKTTTNEFGDTVVVITTRLNPKFVTLVRDEIKKETKLTNAHERAEYNEMIRVFNVVAAQSRADLTINTRTGKLVKFELVGSLNGPVYENTPTYHKKTGKIIGTTRKLGADIAAKLFNTTVYGPASVTEIKAPEGALTPEAFFESLMETSATLGN